MEVASTESSFQKFIFEKWTEIAWYPQRENFTDRDMRRKGEGRERRKEAEKEGKKGGEQHVGMFMIIGFLLRSLKFHEMLALRLF